MRHELCLRVIQAKRIGNGAYTSGTNVVKAWDHWCFCQNSFCGVGKAQSSSSRLNMRGGMGIELELCRLFSKVREIGTKEVHGRSLTFPFWNTKQGSLLRKRERLLKRILQRNEEEWEFWRDFEKNVKGLEDSRMEPNKEKQKNGRAASTQPELETMNGINLLTQMCGLTLGQFPKSIPVVPTFQNTCAGRPVTWNSPHVSSLPEECSFMWSCHILGLVAGTSLYLDLETLEIPRKEPWTLLDLPELEKSCLAGSNTP